VRLLAAICALLALSLGMASGADAARKHKRSLCNPPNTKILKRTSAVRILYVERPDDTDIYGTPAKVFACYPARQRRIKLFEIADTESWKAQVMRIRNRWFAFGADTVDLACEKYAQPDCSSSYVAVFDLKSGKVRCTTSAHAGALALTSNGWIAWLVQGASGQPSTLSACDSAGVRQLDQGTIDPASVTAVGAAVEWMRDGQPQSATLG
jgi:hypothetical protein